jgi:hypothetical protein
MCQPCLAHIDFQPHSRFVLQSERPQYRGAIVTRAVANKNGRRKMTAHLAARSALRIAIRCAIADLIENEGPDYARETYAAARRKLKAIIRRRRHAPVQDIAKLREALLKKVPESHRDGTAAALADLEDALGSETMVERDVSYLIGVAVGQEVRGHEGWELFSVGDSVVESPRSQRRRRR